jgi:nitrite reductase (NADH) small subunit
MDGTQKTTHWQSICALDDIVPETGVAARLGAEQIAIFRLKDDRVFAISNYDPNSDAAVLSRGIVGSLGARVVVASPIYKQHFDLTTGECLEAPEHSIRAYAVRVDAGRVLVGLPA